MNRYFIFFIVIICGCCAACGSGGNTAKVTGTVTLDGVPLSIGSVVIADEKGNVVGTGMIREGGSYAVAEAPVGKTKIVVKMPALIDQGKPKDAPKPKLPDKTKPPDATAPPDLGIAQGVLEVAGKVPMFYQDMGKTPLVFEVKTGDNQFDIKMSAKGHDKHMPPPPPFPGGFPPPPPPPPR